MAADYTVTWAHEHYQNYLGDYFEDVEHNEKQSYKAFIHSSKEYYDKAIICIRHPKASIASKISLSGGDQEKCELLHLQRLENLYSHLTSLDEFPYYINDYDSLMDTPASSIGALADFLGLEITDSALDVISSDLRRYNADSIERVNEERGKDMIALYEEIKIS